MEEAIRRAGGGQEETATSAVAPTHCSFKALECQNCTTGAEVNIYSHQYPHMEQGMIVDISTNSFTNRQKEKTA